MHERVAQVAGASDKNKECAAYAPGRNASRNR
jgi:hypothetical protein